MDERAGVVGAAIAALRELPEVRPEATAQLLVAVAAERQRDRERESNRRMVPRRWVWSGLAAAALVSAAILALPRGRKTPVPLAARATVAANATHLITSGSAVDAAEAPRSVELVFSAPGAKTVRVVGDFNGWNDRQSPMMRDGASGLWNVSLMLRPGRHVYAFVVNDTQWVRDPRATAAPDADFGRPGSVVLVGRP